MKEVLLASLWTYFKSKDFIGGVCNVLSVEPKTAHYKSSSKRHTRLMAATSSDGPTSKEVPLSAMALQPSLQVPEVPGTFTLSMAICQ